MADFFIYAMPVVTAISVQNRTVVLCLKTALLTR